MYATDSPRCPVKFYKKFKIHRPSEMNTAAAPSNTSDLQLIGKNEISKFMSKAARNAGLQQRPGSKVNNHSVRKTSISRLLDAEIPENFVAQLSGHKSTESLQSYKSASEKQQQKMSLALSRDPEVSSVNRSSNANNTQHMVATMSSTLFRSETGVAANTAVSSGDVVNSDRAVFFHGANIGTVSGCSFQIFHGPVTLVQEGERKRRRVVIESDEED